MNCPNCGAPNDPNTKFCSTCGTRIDTPPVAPAPAPAPNPTIVNVPNPGYVPAAAAIPPQYRPLSPWAYFGLNILFSVPVVGLVFLIVFAFNKSNINRRNFARSFFCLLLIVVVIGLIVLAITAATGGTIALFDNRH